MTPADFGKEIVYPATHYATALPIIITWILFSLATTFGLFGMFLFLCTLFPFQAYLMRLLQARAMNRDAPAFDAEMMAFFGNPASLFPLALANIFGWTSVAVMHALGTLAGWLFVMAWGAIMPASLSILAVSRSPLESINPIAIYSFIRTTVVDYFPMVILLEFCSGVLIRVFGSESLTDIPLFPVIYLVFLTYSMTGAISAKHGISEQVDIPDALPVTPEQMQKTTIIDRETVANHAYGFASRGNREGAFMHIEQHIAGENDPVEARIWFFNQMTHWDNKDTALFFAQNSLGHLMMAGADRQAMKMLSQCFHVNANFQPAMKDRGALIQLAERFGREDLLRAL